MKTLHDLPLQIFRMIESGVVAEFATVSATGVPIDTPTYYFPADDMSTIDLATGLPNPAKAERARRNPKVGLLIEGRPDEPVVVIRAHAAVRDRDIQSNAIRYLAETGYKGISHGITWEQARLAVTYWSRIIIENTPERIYWWSQPRRARRAAAGLERGPGHCLARIRSRAGWQDEPVRVARARLAHRGRGCGEERQRLPSLAYSTVTDFPCRCARTHSTWWETAFA